MIASLPEPGMGDGVKGVATERDLNRLMSLLTPEQRAVAELSFDFGYSYPEIAEILGIPANTVKTRMFYARQVMQAYYNESSEKKL
jgi:RNA polymerase sigma-70 factor (ECF subfamily)